MRQETSVLHGGREADAATGALAVPIFQTVAYQFDSSAVAAEIFNLERQGYAYSRISNPTCSAFERRVAAAESGVAAVATSTGLAAVTAAILNIAGAGDNIVAATELFGGTTSLFFNTLSRLGIEVRFVRGSDPQQFAAQSDSRTRCYFGETLPNPFLEVFPIDEVASLARERSIPLIVDNTAAPLICRPFEHGANIVIYSASKYIGGHGSTLGGVVVDNDSFPWSDLHGCDHMNAPDPAFQGRVWAQDVGATAALESTAFLLRLRQVCVRDMGLSLSPLNAFLLLQGLESLPLRMRAHCENATCIAALLAGHSSVRKVIHPSIATGEARERADRLLESYGALLQFEIEGDRSDALSFVDRLKMVCLVANVGDARTLVIHPASTTHSQLSPAQLHASGISERTIRVAVGLEHVDDIWADICSALEGS